jgi:hypothetical protein
MPITLNQISTNIAQITLSIRENTVTVVYYPGRVTEAVFAKLSAFKTMDGDSLVEGFTEFNVMLASLIKSWDVFEDDAQSVMFPIDATRFAELPIVFRMQIVSAIMGDLNPEAMASQLN